LKEDMATGGFEVVTKRSEKKNTGFPQGEGKGPRTTQGAYRGRGNYRGEYRGGRGGDR
jgi:hypothetical protein